MIQIFGRLDAGQVLKGGKAGAFADEEPRRKKFGRLGERDRSLLRLD